MCRGESRWAVDTKEYSHREGGTVLSTRFRSLKVRATKATAIASLALFMSMGVVSTAQASTAQASPAQGGARPSDDPVALGCGSAGGGTWCHGSGMDGVFKGCYSNYVHPNNYHSSTASIANDVDKRYASAGAWSRAYAKAGVAYTCNTYYDPNP